MSRSTDLKLQGKVDIEEVFLYIKENIDPDVTMNFYKRDYITSEFESKLKPLIKEVYGNEPLYSVCNYIYFTYKGRRTGIFVYYCNYNCYEGLEYHTGLEDMVKAETTSVILPYDESYMDLAEQLVKHWGGWIDYNDCDDEDFVRVNKNSTTPNKKIRHVSLEEVYKMFGEVVIIDR